MYYISISLVPLCVRQISPRHAHRGEPGNEAHRKEKVSGNKCVSTWIIPSLSDHAPNLIIEVWYTVLYVPRPTLKQTRGISASFSIVLGHCTIPDMQCVCFTRHGGLLYMDTMDLKPWTIYMYTILPPKIDIKQLKSSNTWRGFPLH